MAETIEALVDCGKLPGRSLSFRSVLVLNEIDIRNGWLAAVAGCRRGAGRRSCEVLQVFRKAGEARQWRSDCHAVLDGRYAETHVLEFHETAWLREVRRQDG